MIDHIRNTIRNTTGREWLADIAGLLCLIIFSAALPYVLAAIFGE